MKSSRPAKEVSQIREKIAKRNRIHLILLATNLSIFAWIIFVEIPKAEDLEGLGLALIISTFLIPWIIVQFIVWFIQYSISKRKLKELSESVEAGYYIVTTITLILVILTIIVFVWDMQGSREWKKKQQQETERFEREFEELERTDPRYW